MKKWIVKIDSKAEEQLQMAIQSGALTDDDKKVIVAWIEEIQEEGIESVLNSKFWNDHALIEKWFGHRSSSFSKLGRILYKIDTQNIQVVVVRITLNHDYR